MHVGDSVETDVAGRARRACRRCSSPATATAPPRACASCPPSTSS
jgi:hypothetical protein